MTTRLFWTRELFIKVPAFKHFLKHTQGPPAKPKKTGYCIPYISKIEKIEGKERFFQIFFESHWEARRVEVYLLYKPLFVEHL